MRRSSLYQSGRITGLNKIFFYSFHFLFNSFRKWNNSVQYHFAHLEKKICISTFISLCIFTAIFFFIPYDALFEQKFLPEQISMYGMVDSYPQRLAYSIFLLTVLGSILLFYFKPNQKPLGFFLKTALGMILLIAATITLSTSSLDTRSMMTLGITVAIAIASYFHRFRGAAWIFITVLIACAIIPGFLHTPSPSVSPLQWFDRHYDTVIYRGRQLAEGHLFSRDAPPFYSILFSTFLGIFVKKIHIPDFKDLIRLVQIGQIIALIFYAFAAMIQTRSLNSHSRRMVLVLLALAIVPWLSTEGLAIWFPNQSGLRSLFVPISICIVFLAKNLSFFRASAFIGGTGALALLANFETGIVVVAGLGMAWLLLSHSQSWYQRIAPTIMLLITFFFIFYALALIYHYYFAAWPYRNPIELLSLYFFQFTSGFGGLKLPFRALVILIMAHSSYICVKSILYLLGRTTCTPHIVSSAIATMLLMWFPYYFNRPDDWNLWTFIALYSLLIAPYFKGDNKNILPFIVMSLIVLPISARNLPYFVIDPLNFKINYQTGCASGLILPTDYCHHLNLRANTLKYFASQGTVTWSTVLPVLTSQMANVKNIFWTGDLFNQSVTQKDFENLVNQISDHQVDYILFDDPNDQYLHPKGETHLFNQKLFSALKNEYCSPINSGGWLVAIRKTKSNCSGIV